MAGYTVTQIAAQMGVDSINNESSPVAVGVDYDSVTGNARGMVFKGGTISLPAPLAPNAYANAVNDAETVVGRVGRDRWSGRAFSCRIASGILTDLQPN